MRAEFYTAWVTGLGASTSQLVSSVSLYFDDVPAYGFPHPESGKAKVTYVGAVPQFPGLYQINFQIPESIGTGPAGYGAWPCGSYSWELSLGIGQGVDFPLIIRNGDVPCKP